MLLLALLLLHASQWALSASANARPSKPARSHLMCCGASTKAQASAWHRQASDWPAPGSQQARFGRHATKERLAARHRCGGAPIVSSRKRGTPLC